MYLKSLELSGFKSFAEKSALEFSTPISAIVGPNGSGKSNVAEAFRFVLGEQSLKSMRGKRGEDLIFNGAAEGGRKNRASVKLTIDNSRKILPIDYDEAVIERIVHRDGVNEYFLNGSQVRLKDVTEMLMSSNIGISGHNIISQGEADKILNANPKDRREMVEDTLGLRAYQYKKVESQKKLEKTKENIAQVESLRKEIAPHLRFLKKQVEKIEKSRELKDKLRDFYKEYLKREKNYLEDHKKKVIQELSEPQKELEKVSMEVEKIKQSLENQSEENEKTLVLVELDKEIRDKNDEKLELERKSGRIEGEKKALQNLIDSAEKENASTGIPIEKVREIVAQIDQELENAESEDLLDKIYGFIRRAREVLKIFLKLETQSSKTSDELKNKLIELEDREKEIKNKIIEIDAELEKIREKEKELKSQIEEEKSQGRESERKIFELMEKQNELSGVVNGLKNEQEKLMREEEDFKRELTEAGVLMGREVVNFEDFEVVIDSDEAREVQVERKRELEKMKIRLEEMGGSGQEDVLKEYEETSEREKFLTGEIEDLEKSAGSLEELIKELEEKIETQFNAGIEKINKEFQRFFELMFGGGTAKIEVIKERPPLRKTLKDGLEESDSSSEQEEDEQSSFARVGIDINVNLPRKRIKSLMMLSGGERALTSIALIFAMSQVNPPPFIILDETDAALDEANSKKYGDMIENLAGKSQLILITHNRETMSRAGILYGVTMGASGISKLLSIKFDEAVEVAK